MDPNTALTQAREAADNIHFAAVNDDEGAMAVWAGELAQAFNALDEWLGSGGFYPDAWKK